jgi:hypothetical protein
MNNPKRNKTSRTLDLRSQTIAVLAPSEPRNCRGRPVDGMPHVSTSDCCSTAPQ